MLRDERPADNRFRFYHCLYYRCNQEDVIGNRLLGARISYKNPSVNWSKYGKPWDVIFDFPDSGIAQFVVCALPKELPIEVQLGVKPKPHSFFPAHVPELTNYAHSEIWTFKDGAHVENPRGLPETVKKEFRQIMSDRGVILRKPLR
jgi:hypothetical protein